ncbi:MAG: BlaI/MecI/CopY family transcriptional regulator [Conexibacteraceae bacterium]|nr:BlaI/MecI/CopY family transcriptional regulator [Conexibacteraceae bacterium]
MARKAQQQPPPALHELEAEIMEHVWSHPGEITVRDAMEALNRRAKPARAYTTYMTVMRRLHAKRLLDRERTGPRDSYTARLTRDEYQEQRADVEVRQLVDEFGDVALAHFARSLSGLDPARREALQRLADGGSD